MPDLDEYWRAQFRMRRVDRLSFTLTGAPPNAPISGQPDSQPANGAVAVAISHFSGQPLRPALRLGNPRALFGGSAIRPA